MDTTDRPRLKAGITFPGGGALQSPLLLHGPSNRYFRLTATGLRLLQLFDGTRSIEEIASSFNAGTEDTLTPQRVRELATSSFVQFLDLPDDYGVEEVTLERTKPSYLRLSTMVLSGARVGLLTRYLQVLFAPRIIASSLLLSAALLIIALYQYWGALAYYFNNAPLSDVGPFLFVMLTLSIVHEFGHAAACRYFGVHHGGIGIGFYLLTPVMYADVTAAWQLPARQRIVINLAGIYFELLYCGVLLALLFLTGNPVFLGFTLIVLVHTLYNLNPFFRTDGYWVLTDASGQSNLRLTSNRKLMHAIGKLFGRKGEPTTAAGKSWLVAYAAVTYAFIGFFLYYVIFVFESSLFTFPTAVEDLYYDICMHREITLALLSGYLHQLVIPVIFYYLVFQFALLPLLRRLRRDYWSTAITSG